jgi:hypothetical protein
LHDARNIEEEDRELARMELETELPAARAALRHRRKMTARKAKRKVARDAELAALLPADMTCPGCKRQKPRAQQWSVVDGNGGLRVAVCQGCARIIRGAMRT